MQIADLGDVKLHYRIDGDPDGAPVVFANSLGTDMRLWDPILPMLPAGLKIIRYDKRGHGLSSCPPAPYAMGALVRDAERLLDRYFEPPMTSAERAIADVEGWIFGSSERN